MTATIARLITCEDCDGEGSYSKMGSDNADIETIPCDTCGG